MENATKALIIAAGILLAILIASLGLVIYNMATESADVNETISEMEVLTYNKKYELYEGIKNGGSVKALLEMAANNNKKIYKDPNAEKYSVCIRSNDKKIQEAFKGEYDMTIALNGTRSYGVRYPQSMNRIKKVISSTETYKIWFKYNEYGYIWEINIDSYK